MPNKDSDYIDVEIVSENESRPNPRNTNQNDPFFALVAKLMDNVFQIPGTNIKFGLDPLIGLIPGLGDSSGAIISVMLIFRGAQAGLPRIVLARMAMNVFLNTLVGAIPILGDVFSLWFKSNQLNYELFQRHVGNTRCAPHKDWFFVVGLLFILLASVGFIILCSILLFAALWKYLLS